MVLFFSLSAEEGADIFFKPAFGVGIGEFIQGSLQLVYGNNYFCMRQYVRWNLAEEFKEKSILYGIAREFPTKRRGYLSISAGISSNKYVKYGKDDEPDDKKEFYGIPIDLNVVRGITSFMGIGFNVTVNLNREEISSSYFVNFYLGDFVNDHYKPE